METNYVYLIVALPTSAVGLAAIYYGRKLEDHRFLGTGIAMLALAYFVTSPGPLLFLSLGLTAFLLQEEIQAFIEGDKAPRKIQSVTKQPRHDVGGRRGR